MQEVVDPTVELLKWFQGILDLLKSSEFWSALAGAAVSAIVSFRVQRMIFKDARRQRDGEASDRRLTLGYSALLKMNEVYSNYKQLSDHIDEVFEMAAARGESPWQTLQPLANLADRVAFSIEEKTLILRWKDNDFFNALIEIDRAHNSMLDVYRVLRSRRMALVDNFSAVVIGGQRITGLDPQQEAFFAPKMAEVDNLAEQFREQCKADLERSYELLLRLHQLLKEHIGVGERLIFQQPTKPTA